MLADVAPSTRHLDLSALPATERDERLDEAMAGLYPLGPSKKTLVLGAGVVGLLMGLGIVMILIIQGMRGEKKNFFSSVGVSVVRG